MHEVMTAVRAVVYNPDAESRLFFRESVGSGETTDGEKFDLSVSVAGAPMVEFVDSDEVVQFSWEALVNAAIAARKNQPPPRKKTCQQPKRWQVLM